MVAASRYVDFEALEFLSVGKFFAAWILSAFALTGIGALLGRISERLAPEGEMPEFREMKKTADQLLAEAGEKLDEPSASASGGRITFDPPEKPE